MIHSEHIFVVVVSRVEKVHRSQTYQNRKVARPKSAAPGSMHFARGLLCVLASEYVVRHIKLSYTAGSASNPRITAAFCLRQIQIAKPK